MTEASLIVPLTLPNGARLHVEATPRTRTPTRAGRGEEDVAYTGPSNEIDVAAIPARFEDVAKTIEGIAGALTDAIKRVGPKKASVEFGLEIEAETGGLTALLVKGSGKASLTVTLEWSE